MTIRHSVIGLLILQPLLFAPVLAEEDDAETQARKKQLEERMVEYRTLLRETLLQYGEMAQNHEFDYSTTELDERLNQERVIQSLPFGFTPHERNYILPVSYSSYPNRTSFEAIDSEASMQPLEIKFQLSMKIPVMTDLFNDKGTLFFAYTQTSWWQAYNNEASKPFRETNYKPELFLTLENDIRFLGFTNSYNRIGYAHQSNGRNLPLSRSWNYLYVSSALSKGNWMLELTPRVRIPGMGGEDNNPDLEKYIGYVDLSLAYANNDFEYILSAKGSFEDDGHGGLQLDWSFPIKGKMRGLVQVYAGYGESLIDYNHENYRFSLGLQFTNQLLGSK
ncbi:MAG: phospholipase A [Marinospirillum sp.]|uniref:phospholipase A n=1 Tax=Marinospirillum sp. TaxID=2183934 RepID=UPI0019FA2C7D|nr:phospholipase A [Marinospirillum sp.]MBE0505799.1 phospholipase A [Marinospirillum sp.]